MSGELLEQGTPEWKAARVGKVTASRVVDVIAKIKNGEAAARANYKAQLVAEILSGEPQDDCFVSKDMLYGIEQEQFARAAYETSQGVFVEQVGLIDHPSIPRFAASPDGLVGDDGMIEIKCPKLATHISYILAATIPTIYQTQMASQLACCQNRKWNDFVSFRPELPEHLRLFRVRMVRDDSRIKEIETEVIAFISEVEAMVVRLNNFTGKSAS